MPSIFLAIGHSLVGRQLRAALEGDPRFEIAGEANSEEEMIHLLKQAPTPPSIVLLSSELMGTALPHALQRTMELEQTTRLLAMITSEEDSRAFREQLQIAGAFHVQVIPSNPKTGFDEASKKRFLRLILLFADVYIMNTSWRQLNHSLKSGASSFMNRGKTHKNLGTLPNQKKERFPPIPPIPSSPRKKITNVGRTRLSQASTRYRTIVESRDPKGPRQAWGSPERASAPHETPFTQDIGWQSSLGARDKSNILSEGQPKIGERKERREATESAFSALESVLKSSLKTSENLQVRMPSATFELDSPRTPAAPVAPLLDLTPSVPLALTPPLTAQLSPVTPSELLLPIQESPSEENSIFSDVLPLHHLSEDFSFPRSSPKERIHSPIPSISKLSETPLWSSPIQKMEQEPSFATDPMKRTVGEKRLPYDLLGFVSSTGGLTALESVLSHFPSDFPIPIVVIQHIGVGFEHEFVKVLQRRCTLNISLLEHDVQPRQGIYVAAPGHHVVVGKGSALLLSKEEYDTPYCPSGSVFLKSMAARLNERCVGVILTGMGRDGADGLLDIRKGGGRTFAQDRNSSLVFGMPQAAIQLGAVEQVLSIELIGPAILKMFKEALLENQRLKTPF